MRRNHLARLKRAGTRAGKPNYSLPNRYYPKWMPDTPKGISQPLVGLWHMRRTLKWKLGYISIDGKRNDEWETYSLDKLAYFHKLIDYADYKLKEAEDEYYVKLKEEEKAKYEIIRNGILSDVYDQTETFLEKRKQCLNPNTEVIDMAKMTFEQMMEWSKKQKDFEGSGINWLRLTQGIHMVRFLSVEDQDYFMAYTQHDCGQQKDFRSWLCWDWIMDNKEAREYFDEKELITEEDAKKAKKYGDPVCNVIEVIKKYVKNMEPVYQALRTKTRCIFNTFYVFQAYPDLSKIKDENRIMPGNYILEKSVGFNKMIIGAMNAAVNGNVEGDDIEPLSLISHDEGKLLAIQVEGEGIGKNKRTYTMDFKGKPGPIMYTENGTNPYQKGAERLTLPDGFEAYNLMDAVAMRFQSYQEVINQIKAIPTISRIIEQIGYEIPGDEPSDNPLDDNYDKSFAQRTVGKPIAVKKINEDSGLSKVQKSKKEDWEDEEVLEKEKKQVQSKKVIQIDEEEEEEPKSRPVSSKGTKVSKSVVELDDDDDLAWDEDDAPVQTSKKKNSFEERVPPSDPEKEVITNAPKGKRKIF
jgi:hypothetical protein